VNRKEFFKKYARSGSVNIWDWARRKGAGKEFDKLTDKRKGFKKERKMQYNDNNSHLLYTTGRNAIMRM
jgi:hypothetical protein